MGLTGPAGLTRSTLAIFLMGLARGTGRTRTTGMTGATGATRATGVTGAIGTDRPAVTTLTCEYLYGHARIGAGTGGAVKVA